MRFDHTTLLTDDLDRLSGFYGNLPGFVVKQPSQAGYTEVVVADSVFGLFERKSLGDSLSVDLHASAGGGTAIVQVLVEDVDVMGKELQESGVKILVPPTNLPWGSRSTYIQDTDGNLVEFYSWG